MGCLLSVSSNTCVNVVDLAAVGSVGEATLRRRKRSLLGAARYPSLFHSKRKDDDDIFTHAPGAKKKTGFMVADALRNLQRAHSFRHGECYVCNYKKGCNGVCIHREIFTSVKPGYYSSYYESHADIKRESSIRKSLPVIQALTKKIDPTSLTRDIGSRRTLNPPSRRSFKAKNRRSMRNITAFPADAPTPELGIKPQMSYTFQRRSIAHGMYEVSIDGYDSKNSDPAIAAYDGRLDMNFTVHREDLVMSSHIIEHSTDIDEDMYEPVKPTLPKKTRNRLQNKIYSSNRAITKSSVYNSMNRGNLTASDFGLVKSQGSNPLFEKDLPGNRTYGTLYGARSGEISDCVLSTSSDGNVSYDEPTISASEQQDSSLNSELFYPAPSSQNRFKTYQNVKGSPEYLNSESSPRLNANTNESANDGESSSMTGETVQIHDAVSEYTQRNN
ncbi:unnamed protein product, partial [Meganyctiphanes norvegica]